MSAFRQEPAGAGAEGVLHLVMEDPERPANLLDAAAFEDLDRALAELEAAPGLRGVVLRSARADFAAGDVGELERTADGPAATARARGGQQVLGRLAALPCPTVAAVHGACLGPGLELALACSSRVAAEEPTTRFALPEVLIGTLPATGGATRLARLVGLSAALDLVLSGRVFGAAEAERIGLVARAVPGAWLVAHAHRRLAELARGRRGPARDRWRPRDLRARLADGTALGRSLALTRARARIRAGGGESYPAPVAALSVLRLGQGQPAEVSMRLEAEWAGDLAGGPVQRNLLRLFRLGERARRETPTGTGEVAPVRVLQVLGAGVTGTAIAESALRHGIEVRLRDTDPDALGRALARIRAGIDARLARGAIGTAEAEAQWARLFPSIELAGLRRADAAIEATGDELDAKRRGFGELEVRMRPDAVLATTAAFLPLEELASGLERPDRLVGLHFPGPGAGTPVVEVVRGPRTAPEAVAIATALVLRLGRTPVPVADRPGLVVERVLQPWLREALHLLEEGFRVADVDAAMRAFGMARGPCAWMDEAGLDSVARGLEATSRAFPERIAPAPALERLVAAGRTGRAAGAGLYLHRHGRSRPDHWAPRRLGAVRDRRPERLEALADRMVLAMVNEAAWALEDGAAPDAGWIDLALVHGAGFPPFRGGPLRYADAIGLERVESRLTALRAERGERYRPAPAIARLAAQGGALTD